MITWTGILTLVNLAIMVGTTLGIVWAFRSSKSRSEREIGERVRLALHEENELLQSRLKRIEGENKHLNDMLQLVIDMLKKTRNITLEIDTTNSIVTFRGKDGTIQVSRLPDDSAK